MEEEVQASFEAGTLPGWEDKGAGAQASTSSSGIDLEAFDSPDELESIGEHCSCRGVHRNELVKWETLT